MTTGFDNMKTIGVFDKQCFSMVGLLQLPITEQQVTKYLVL